MSQITLQNLDRLCAECGHQMAEQVNKAFNKKRDTENLITKSLGVLQENGVYALFLYMASQVEEKKGEEEKEGKASKAAKTLANQSAALLVNDPPALLRKEVDRSYQNAMESIRNRGGLADDLDKLLLAKRLLEQALIYARYHAKALPDKQEK